MKIPEFVEKVLGIKLCEFQYEILKRLDPAKSRISCVVKRIPFKHYEVRFNGHTEFWRLQGDMAERVGKIEVTRV